MPAPSDLVAHLRVGPAEELAGATTRSHLSDGRCVGWFGPGRVVVDAEVDRAVPARLASRYGAELFWERWTAAECRAKAAGVPIARWLRRHGLGPTLRRGGPVVRTFRLDDVVVSVLDVGS